MAFMLLRNAPSIPTLLSVFIRNGSCTLSNAISASIDMIMCFLSFLLFIDILFIDMWLLYYPCIPGMNHTWSWCMIFLMYCLMQFVNILLRIVASMFISDIELMFSFFVMSLPDLGLGWCSFHKKSLGVFHLLESFWVICGVWGSALP